MAAPPGQQKVQSNRGITRFAQEVETAADPPCDLIRCTLRTCAALVPGWRDYEAGCARRRGNYVVVVVKVCYPYLFI